MAVPADRKVPLLHAFYHLFEHGGSADLLDLSNIGEKPEEVELLDNIHRLIAVHASLKPEYQEVIVEICKEMGAGMAKYLDKEVETEEEYNEYCYYVAGLVGVGLSGLFAASGLEDPRYADMKALSNACGQALQKTNITRDMQEDLGEGRVFWPKDIVHQYVTRMEDMVNPKHRTMALRCLNHMVLLCVQHAPDTLSYMAGLVTPEVLRFVAIPQVMALGTVAILYNNPEVLEKNVKMRKGLTARIFMSINSFADVCRWYLVFTRQLRDAVGSPSNEVETRMVAVLDKVEAICAEHVDDGFSAMDWAVAGAWAASSVYLLQKTLHSHL